MNIITFDYTKANGVTSKRVLSPIVLPNTMYEGIDISELEDEQQAEYVVEIETARAVFTAECFRIQAKFDVKTNYRRFNPALMTNVVKDTI